MFVQIDQPQGSVRLMKPTEDLMNEHRVIERMLVIVQRAADRLEDGQAVEADVFTGAVDFFKNFADRCHHGKEEKLLFEKLIERGMSRTEGPIAVMLREHDLGRAYVREIGELSSKGFDAGSKAGLIENGRAYAKLLHQHIQKEDRVLYPTANRILTAFD